jgi:hypothetical protein
MTTSNSSDEKAHSTNDIVLERQWCWYFDAPPAGATAKQYVCVVDLLLCILCRGLCMLFVDVFFSISFDYCKTCRFILKSSVIVGDFDLACAVCVVWKSAPCVFVGGACIVCALTARRVIDTHRWARFSMFWSVVVMVEQKTRSYRRSAPRYTQPRCFVSISRIS